MPKRIVDGEAIWTSKKLRQVEPEWYRAEYANLIPLALANGVFEYDPQAIWAKVYATNRPSVTPEDVRKILDSYGIHKLLFRFRTESNNSEWCFWVGIDRPGRLPSESRRGNNEKVGPPVPAAELQRFLMDANGIHTEANGFHRARGHGLGLGLGLGKEPPIVPRKRGTNMPVGFDEFWVAYPRKTAKPNAVRAFAKINPNPEVLAEMLQAISTQSASDQWRRDDGRFIPHPATWLNQRRWEDQPTKLTVAAKPRFDEEKFYRENPMVFPPREQ